MAAVVLPVTKRSKLSRTASIEFFSGDLMSANVELFSASRCAEDGDKNQKFRTVDVVPLSDTVK